MLMDTSKGRSVRLSTIRGVSRRIHNAYEAQHVETKSALQNRQNMTISQVHQEAAKIKERLGILNRDMIPLYREGMTVSANGAVIDDVDFFNKIRGELKPATDIKFRTSTIDDVVNRILRGEVYDTPWKLSDAIWQHTDEAMREINMLLASAAANGLPASELADMLEHYVNPSKAKPGWKWSRVYPHSGKTVEYNAQRLARTLISHAYRVTQEERIRDNPFVENEQWLESGTERTCDLCRELAYTDQHGLGEGVFPKGEAPLDHPNGLCTLVPITSDLSFCASRLAQWTNGEIQDPALDRYAMRFI